MRLPSFNNAKVLTKERERELLVLNSKGDMDAREELVRNNQFLVLKIAANYTRFLSHSTGSTLEDLIQEGNIGLLRAIDKFNIKNKVRLSTYAIYWINQKIHRYLEAKTLLIHIPLQVQSRYKKLIWKLRTNPEYKIPKRDKIFFDKLGIRLDLESSLRYPTCDFEKTTIQKFLYTPNKDVDKLYEEDAVKKYLFGLEELTEKQKQIVVMKLGIGCPPMTFFEIGELMGRQGMTIKNHFENALRVLREKYKKSGTLF